MRVKPNLKNFKDPTEFLENGAADKAESKYSSNKIKKSDVIPTQQKIFRLPVDVVNNLKLHVTKLQIESGKRITETDIIESLLRKYLNMSK
ncbi:hypothetical protein [Arsenophonus nasoniae]|jgi:hypothetical protein|uniref:Uncharacterized protein n=1 Tax=Arsenophonus nasoniae TaxID=638 RepID=A0AA95GG79_9GAMM|nr:hypothetical protein [Arsenophonus nasoniae]WGL94016.1 hypothetical protein QE207_01345 [Arsenophonus nasoniae]